jgi:hypothetical protein
MSRMLGAIGLCVVGFTLAIPQDVFAQVPVPTVPVRVTNTPTVTIEQGTLYYEVLGVQINVNGAVAGTPGVAVPAGKRRIITSVSARWACTAGHGALVQIFGDVTLFLPGQRAYTEAMGRDTYAMVSQVNIAQGPGTRWVPIIESDGSTCLADIFVSGIEIPDRP